MEILTPIIQNFLNKHQFIYWIVILIIGIYFLMIFIKAFMYFLTEVRFIKLNNLQKIKEEYLKNINKENNNLKIKEIEELIDSIIVNEIFQKITGLKISNIISKELFLELIKKTPYNYKYIKTIFPYIKISQTDNNRDLISSIEININFFDKLLYIIANIYLIIPFFILSISFMFWIINMDIKFLVLTFIGLILIFPIKSYYISIYLALNFEKEFLKKSNKWKKIMLYLPKIMIIIGLVSGILLTHLLINDTLPNIKKEIKNKKLKTSKKQRLNNMPNRKLNTNNKE